MKIWTAVRLYAGNIDEMRAFPSREEAKFWFDDAVRNLGGKEACDVGDYHEGAKVLYFFDSMAGGRNELKAQPCDLDLAAETRH